MPCDEPMRFLRDHGEKLVSLKGTVGIMAHVCFVFFFSIEKHDSWKAKQDSTVALMQG